MSFMPGDPRRSSGDRHRDGVLSVAFAVCGLVVFLGEAYLLLASLSQRHRAQGTWPMWIAMFLYFVPLVIGGAALGLAVGGAVGLWRPAAAEGGGPGPNRLGRLRLA